MENQPINLLDYEQLARDKLSKMIYDYFAGGADNGITLRENNSAYDRIRLLPRVLVDVHQRDTSMSLLGAKIPAPIVIAPMALGGMAHPLAEVAMARGADGLPMTLSMMVSIHLSMNHTESHRSKGFYMGHQGTNFPKWRKFSRVGE
jgi:isopentenyl diphosphate isomerase/L-lactate dehydrogenase-like FMN-dependent dehydrogenase